MTHDTDPGTREDPQETTRRALLAPSTRFVLWTGGDSPRMTALISEPGARISAEVFDSHTVIVTTQDGTQVTTDFRAATALPPYNSATGKFGTGDERVAAYDGHKHPAVGQDIVVGQPLWGVGLPVSRVSISHDATMTGLGGNFDDVVLNRIQTPTDTFALPDPTLAADAFLARAHEKFGARHATGNA